MVKDMTAGPPAKLIVRFALPLMLGNLFQQFYSMVDAVIVGRYLGKNPLAAVGSTSSLNFLIIGFCLGLLPFKSVTGKSSVATTRSLVT